jgi:hypothetical protein
MPVEIRTGSTVDGSVDATAAEQTAVGGVDNGIAPELGDVSKNGVHGAGCGEAESGIDFQPMSRSDGLSDCAKIQPREEGVAFGGLTHGLEAHATVVWRTGKRICVLDGDRCFGVFDTFICQLPDFTHENSF